MFGVQPARFTVAENPRPDVVPHPVIDGIAQHRGNDQQQHQQVDVHAARRSHGAGDEQQRVTGQERCHHQPGFAEYDQEQDQVDPGAVAGHQRLEMLIQMQDNIHQLREQLHAAT